MKIVEIRDQAIPLEGNISNAVVSFADHTVTLLCVVSDVIRDGRPVMGFAFNSIGRFAQSGILRERMIPRVLAARPDSLLDDDGHMSPRNVLTTAMLNEKPGGHGDRSGAAAALELAIWDLNARLRDEPAYVTISRAYGRSIERRPAQVYAAGGYYYDRESSVSSLREELSRYRDMGFNAYKMKVGGMPLKEDMLRIEAALEIAGEGARLSVDANGRFNIEEALAFAREIAPLNLRWFEEVGDPLDYDLNRRLTEQYDGPVATGENLFSLRDVENLLNFGGVRPGKDIFQMDAGLSYGLTEYVRMIDLMESRGFGRDRAFPHGGHMINLHIAVALGLGGCEAYPGVFNPFGGYASACAVGDGVVWPTDVPGFGLELKEGLKVHIDQLAA